MLRCGRAQSWRMVLVAVVKLRYALNFAVACEDAGCDPLKLLQAVEIDERMIQDPELMIAEHQLWTLASNAATSTGKFDIGFDAGSVSSVQMHGALRQLYNQKSLFERLVTFCKMAKLEYSRADFFVRPTFNGLVFGRKAIVGDREQVRQVELYVLQLMLETIRSSLDPAWVPKKLNLQSDHHVDLEWLAQSPETRLRFAQSVTEIHIECSEAVPRAAHFANDHVGATSSAVGDLIETYFIDPRLSLPFVARLIGLGERKLQRDLENEGCSFSQILARKRIEVASEMLKEPALSIFEISKSLGYSNQAHFTRAFIRSTGMTPSQFRRCV